MTEGHGMEALRGKTTLQEILEVAAVSRALRARSTPS